MLLAIGLRLVYGLLKGLGRLLRNASPRFYQPASLIVGYLRLHKYKSARLKREFYQIFHDYNQLLLQLIIFGEVEFLANRRKSKSEQF